MGRWRACCLSAGRFRRTQIVFLDRANRPSERGELRALLFANRAVRWRKEGKRKRHWKRARVELRARALSAAAQEASGLHKILSRTRASALHRMTEIRSRTRACALPESVWGTRAQRAGAVPAAAQEALPLHRILSRTRASALREHLSRARARRARAVPAAAQEALPLHRILWRTRPCGLGGRRWRAMQSRAWGTAPRSP